MKKEMKTTAVPKWQDTATPDGNAMAEGMPLCEAEINPDKPDPALVNKWGFGPAKTPYRIVDYQRLEEIYAAYAQEHPNRSLQAELSLMKICRWTLQQEHCFEEGEWGDVKNLQALIKAELDNEQARRKEAAQRENARLDDIVAAVEKAGLPMMDYDELCKELANRAFHKTYPYTRDAADKMLLLIRNATAWNEGQPEISQLPPELRMDDPLQEFAPKADATEAALMAELGL